MSATVDRSSQRGGWRITIQDLLVLITASAPILAFLGPHFQAEPWMLLSALLFALPLLVTALAAPAAWRNLKARENLGSADSQDFGPERFAFRIGLFAVSPYAILWSMAMLAELAGGASIVNRLFVLIGFAVALAYLPLMLALVYSLEAFWGFRSNPPLLVMRLTTLVGNLLLLAIPVLGIVVGD
ncbi:MAG: hypothetical protein ABUL64_03755 [Singulisphaera sp.]